MSLSDTSKPSKDENVCTADEVSKMLYKITSSGDGDLKSNIKNIDDLKRLKKEFENILKI